MTPSVASFRRVPTRRLLQLAVSFVLLPIIYFLVRGCIRYLLFYSSGEFVQYHMEMTPAIVAAGAPVSGVEVGYSAVILYLINASQLREFMLSLYYVHHNVPTRQWPIILFYADDMDDSTARVEFMLRLYDFLGGGRKARQFLSRIEFERVEWSLPPGISQSKADVDPVFIHAWPGYHLMSGFFATQIFHHPRLRDVTYYMRLDTNSYIFKPLCYDPLEVFNERNRSYGYRSRASEPAWLTHGMWQFTDAFVRSRSDIEKNLEKNGWMWPTGREPKRMKHAPYPTYNSDFEIIRLESFRRPDVREWLSEIDRDPERIYKYRWSDGAIRYATVNMFLDGEKDVEEYCGLQYWHNGVAGNHCPCDK